MAEYLIHTMNRQDNDMANLGVMTGPIPLYAHHAYRESGRGLL